MIHAIHTPAAWEKAAVVGVSGLAVGMSSLVGRATIFSAYQEKGENLITLFEERAPWEKRVYSILSTACFAISALSFFFYAVFTFEHNALGLKILAFPLVQKLLVSGASFLLIGILMKVIQSNIDWVDRPIREEPVI